MKRILVGVRFLLRPGWLALTAAVLGFAFVCYYLLAPWQFHRSTERDGENAALQTAVSVAPVPRASLVTPGRAPTPDIDYRQVVVTGTYDPSGEVLVRLRTVDGGAANEVVTPLRTDTGETVLIDRGYVRPGGTGAVPSIAPAPAGTVTLVGHQRVDEPRSDRPTLVQNGHREVYAVNAGLIATATGVAAGPGYVALEAGQPGVLTAVPLPLPDPNPSYSYAWQWLIFGVMAIGAWFYFVRLEYVARRGVRTTDASWERSPTDPRDRPDGTAWDHDAADRDPAPVPDGQGSAPDDGPDNFPDNVPDSAPAATTTERALADRYGRR